MNRERKSFSVMVVLIFLLLAMGIAGTLELQEENPVPLEARR